MKKFLYLPGGKNGVMETKEGGVEQFDRSRRMPSKDLATKTGGETPITGELKLGERRPTKIDGGASAGPKTSVETSRRGKVKITRKELPKRLKWYRARGSSPAENGNDISFGLVSQLVSFNVERGEVRSKLERTSKRKRQGKGRRSPPYERKEGEGGGTQHQEE